MQSSWDERKKERKDKKREFRGWEILWGTWQPPEIGLGVSPFRNLLIRPTEYTAWMLQVIQDKNRSNLPYMAGYILISLLKRNLPCV